MADEILDQIDEVCDRLAAALERSATIEDTALTAAAAAALAAAVARRTLVAGMPGPTVFELASGVEPADIRATGAQARGDVRRTAARLVRVCDALGEETAAAAMNSALIALGGAGMACRPRMKDAGRR